MKNNTISRQELNELNLEASKIYRNVFSMEGHSIDPVTRASGEVVKQVLSKLGITVAQDGVEIPSETDRTGEEPSSSDESINTGEESHTAQPGANDDNTPSASDSESSEPDNTQPTV